MKTLRKRSWAAAWCIVACGMIVCDGDAWAQAPPAASPPASAQAGAAAKQAEQRYDAGIAFVKSDKWAEAREEFRQAYAASAQLKYLAALIKAEIATGQHANAATHLVALLARRGELDPNTLAEAEAKLSELRKKIGAATITVNVEGAEVLVDGVVVGRSPVSGEVFVNSGRRMFQARKAGFVTAEQPVDVAPGSAPRVALGLTKGSGPGEGPVGPGNEGGGGPNKTVVYVGIGVASALAVVGFGTAIGAAVAEKKSYDDWDQANCTATPTASCYNNFNEQENKRFLLRNTAFYTFVGATAVGAGTLVYALMAKKLEKPSPHKQAVCVEPTVGGIVIRGRF